MEQQPPASLLLAPQSAPAVPSAPPLQQAPRKKRRWIWVVLLVIFALAFVWVLRQKPGVSSDQAGRTRQRGGMVTINAAKAGRGQLAVKLDAIGTVTPTYTASIVSQVSGQVLNVHYREGETVQRGTPLIDIDPRQYQATLDTALGALARDRGVLEQAEMDLERYQAAWARNAIAKQLLDDQLKLVDQDKGLVKADEGTVETDQVQVNFCHIVAPITGRVGLRLVDPGNVVAANSTTALVVVAQVQPITVVFTIPEDSLPQVESAMRRIHGGLETAVFDRADEHQLAAGKLISLDNQIDTSTGSLKLRAVFANKDMALYPNQFVNTKLLVDVQHNQIMIPNSAIQRNAQQAFVYRIQNNVANMVNIKVGASDGPMTAVEGINEGDLIADSSFEKLQNKAKVRIVAQKLGTTDEESDTP